MEAILAGRIQAGDVVVIRYEGPAGAALRRCWPSRRDEGPGRSRMPLSSPTGVLGWHPRLLRRPCRAEAVDAGRRVRRDGDGS